MYGRKICTFYIMIAAGEHTNEFHNLALEERSMKYNLWNLINSMWRHRVLWSSVLCST
jgi:hypothetical protein